MVELTEQFKYLRVMSCCKALVRGIQIVLISFWPIFFLLLIVALSISFTGFFRCLLKISLVDEEVICIAVRLATFLKTILGKVRKNSSDEQLEPNILEYPNDMLTIPLPKFYTNGSNSQQDPILRFKQIYLASKEANHETAARIEQGADIYQETIHQMKVYSHMRKDEIDDAELIKNHFQANAYTLQEEFLFSEMFFNGENPYQLKQYRCTKGYQFQNSIHIEKEYQDAILDQIGKEAFNEDILKKVKMSKDEIKLEIEKGTQIYSCLMEDLEAITKGKMATNIRKVLFDDEIMEVEAYIHATYPIFMKITNPTTKVEGYICLAVAIKYSSQPLLVKVFSPFFQKQPFKLWQLVRAHSAQGLFNDFTVKIHLGILHFSTNQYLVPLYNFRDQLKAGTDPKRRLNLFLKYGFDIFNKGLEGINAGATSTLVNPIAEYALTNNVFAFDFPILLEILSHYSNKVNFNIYNPLNLAKKNNIESLLEDPQNQIFYDSKLLDILGTYIKQLYVLFGIDELEVGLIDEINKESQNMYAGKKEGPRPDEKTQSDPREDSMTSFQMSQINGKYIRPLIQKKGLLQLLQNLVFCWVVYHSHTFSTVSTGIYYKYKPSFLCIPISPKDEEWNQIDIKKIAPPTKILMESNKLTQATTVQDPDNYIIDVIERKKIEASRENQLGVVEACEKLLTGLKQFKISVEKLNKKRFSENKFKLNWLDPEYMQCSLNI